MSFASKLGLMLLITCASPLHAQRDSTLDPGARIRVLVPNQPKLLVGTFGGRTDSTLVVDTDSGQVTLPIQDVAQLWVSGSKRHSHAALGALVGGLVGLGAGLVIGSATAQPCPQQGWEAFGCEFGQLPQQGGAALGGLALGVLAGAVIGGSGGGEHWTSVPLAAARPAR
jgi:hypothetical protein